jgi:hypothetical protein
MIRPRSVKGNFMAAYRRALAARHAAAPQAQR